LKNFIHYAAAFLLKRPPGIVCEQSLDIEGNFSNQTMSEFSVRL